MAQQQRLRHSIWMDMMPTVPMRDTDWEALRSIIMHFEAGCHIHISEEDDILTDEDYYSADDDDMEPSSKKPKGSKENPIVIDPEEGTKENPIVV